MHKEHMHTHKEPRDAHSFRGRVNPGPGRVVIQILPESEDYTIPGTSVRLWLPRPSSHEGFTGRVDVACSSYRDAATGEVFDPIYKKDDIVVVGKFTGTKITLNRTEYVICRERDIVCQIISENTEDSLRASAVSQDTTA